LQSTGLVAAVADIGTLGDFAPMQIAAIIFAMLAVVIVVAMFVRSRTREGIPVFKLTARDKAELKETRRVFGIRRILARLLGGFAGVCFIGGVVCLFYREASGRVDCITAVIMIILGQILLLCAVLLWRSTK
jgi:hypothetical protein